MRFNYINSMMQRMNRAVGEAAEMTRILDEPRLVEDAPGAPEEEIRRAAGLAHALEFIDRLPAGLDTC